MNSNIEIINGDCLECLPKIDKKIDLVLVDLPYGQVKCHWDKKIDLSKMWSELKRICKQSCVICFFCTTKFGYELIHSNPKWFRYDIVWEKYNTVGFLNAHLMPLRKHEMLYVFANPDKSDKNCERNIEMRAYAKHIFEKLGKTKAELNKIKGIKGFINSFDKKVFSYPSREAYEKLTEKYELRKMDGFKEYDNFPVFEKCKRNCYNPQKTKNPKYKKTDETDEKEIHLSEGTMQESVYGPIYSSRKKNSEKLNPTSIIKFGYDKNKFHKTQKPVKLCEWIIKTFSNEGDLVLDFTMGSGSTGVACLNTNRNFIGIEKNKQIFEIAKKRLAKNSK